MLDNLVWLAFDMLLLLMLARCVISWFRPSHYHPIVRWVEKTTDPLLAPIQRILPPWKTGGLDFSPAIVLLIAWVIARVLTEILP